MDRDSVVVVLYSRRGEDASLRRAIERLSRSAGRFRVFLDGYDTVPSLPGGLRIDLRRSQDYGDLGDLGPFLWGADDERCDAKGYRIIADAALDLPEDVVERLVERLDHYGLKAVVGLDGVLYKQPVARFGDQAFRHEHGVAGECRHDHAVHRLEPTVLAYSAGAFRTPAPDAGFRGFAGLWLALAARRQGLPLVCLRRPAGWIGAAAPRDWPAAGIGRRRQLELERHALAAHAPYSVGRVVRRGSPPRRKLVLGVITWNRRDYLEQALASWLATRSPDHDWVVIVADDGSTDDTLPWLARLRLPHELHVIHNRRRYAGGQTNSILALARRIGFDVGFKIDDDVRFVRPGWDGLYLDAIERSGYGHLCHFNVEHMTWLRRRDKPDYVLPPPRPDASGACLAYGDVAMAGGSLFTFTPALLDKVGFADEANFPIRGLWHIDYSFRACRAGFNDEHRFYDAAGSGDYIELQENTPGYRCSLPWGEAYKKARAPAELARRWRVCRDASRVFIPSPAAPRPRGRGLDDVFEKVLVLNLDRRPDRLAAVLAGAARHGIAVERFPAVDGSAEPHRSEWQRYAAGALVEQPRALPAVDGTRAFYRSYASDVARLAFFERFTRGKAIKSPGAWGYLKTMKLLLERAMDEDWESVLVLDDDVVFHRRFGALFEQVAGELPPAWRLLQLGALQYDWRGDAVVWHSEHLYRCNGSSVGSFAVGMHRRVYATLYQYTCRFDLPYDIGPLHVPKRLDAEECLITAPNLVIPTADDSDINSSDRMAAEAAKAANVYRWDRADYEAGRAESASA